MPGYRKPKMPKPNSPTGSVTRSVSNTGEMSTSTQTTGATGAVRNTTNIVSSGTAGVSGAIQSISPNVTWDGNNVTINTDAYNAANVQAGSDAIRGAFAQVEGELASARQRALGMVPTEYKDRVNEHFDRAGTQVSEQRKRLGY